jgi:hypothetical protein
MTSGQKLIVLLFGIVLAWPITNIVCALYFSKASGEVSKSGDERCRFRLGDCGYYKNTGWSVLVFDSWVVKKRDGTQIELCRVLTPNWSGGNASEETLYVNADDLEGPSEQAEEAHWAQSNEGKQRKESE